MRDRTLLIGSLTVVAAASGFGLLGPISRFAYDAGLDPISFVAWRAAFGTFIVVLFAAWMIRRGRAFVAPWRLPARARAALIVAAITGMVLNLGMFFAFSLTTIAIALFAFYTYPAFVAVAEIVLGHERLDSTRAAALGLSLGGMVLVVAGGLSGGGDVHVDPLGIGLALVAAISQTVFILISRDGYSALPAEQAMTWIIGATMVVCGFLSLASIGPGALAVPLIEPQALALVAIAGIVAAGIPSVLFLTGIRTIGGTRAGILMLFEPVVGVALAALLLDEALHPIQLVGGLAVLAAAVVLQRSGAPEPVGRNAAALAGGIER